VDDHAETGHQNARPATDASEKASKRAESPPVLKVPIVGKVGRHAQASRNEEAALRKLVSKRRREMKRRKRMDKRIRKQARMQMSWKRTVSASHLHSGLANGPLFGVDFGSETVGSMRGLGRKENLMSRSEGFIRPAWDASSMSLYEHKSGEGSPVSPYGGQNQSKGEPSAARKSLGNRLAPLSVELVLPLSAAPSKLMREVLTSGGDAELESKAARRQANARSRLL